MIVLYVLFVLLTCLDNVWMYKTVTNNNQLTEKQKAYVLSIKSSLTMFVLGIAGLYQCWEAGGNLDEYSKNGLQLNKLAVLSFIGYLICDCVIGASDYKKYIQTLSGYTHHIAYIIINTISLISGKYPLYMLYMIEELPTILLSIGSYNKKYRSDTLFGLTFFLTRILYHVILTWWLRHDTTVLVFSMMVLSLHIYWFYGWCKARLRKRHTQKKQESKATN